MSMIFSTFAIQTSISKVRFDILLNRIGETQIDETFNLTLTG